MKRLIFFSIYVLLFYCTSLNGADHNSGKIIVKRHHDDFDLIFKQSEAFLENFYQVLSDFNDEIDRLLPQSQQWLKDAEVKYQELDYLFALNEINIFRQGFIYKQINDLFQQLEKTIISYDQNIQDSYDSLKMMEGLSSRLKLIQLNDPEDIRKRDLILEKLTSVETIINKRLKKLESGRAEYFRVYLVIKKRIEALRGMLNNDFKSLLFQREPGVIDIYFWRFIIVPVFDLWFSNLFSTIVLQASLTLNEFLLLVLILTFISIPIYFSVKKYCQKKYLEFFKDYPYSISIIHWSFIFLVLIIAVRCFSWVISPKEYQLVEIVRVALIALCFTFFSWGIKSRLTDKKLPIPFLPLYGLFLFGLVMRLTAAEFGVVAIIFPLVCLIAILRLIKKAKMDYPRFERYSIIVSIPLCSLMLILSLVGFGYLSLFMSFVWFALCCVLQTGISVTLFYERTIKTQIQYHSFAGVLVLALVVPFLWIFLMFRFIYAVTNFFYMTHFLYSYIDYEVDFYGISISLMDVFIAVILFVIFRGIILMVKYFYKYLKEDTTEFQHSMVSIANYLVWGFYIIIVLKLLNVNYTSILVVLGGMSVGIGFGLQHIVNNFLCGLILLFGNELRPGDIIEVNGVWAYVLKVNIRSTVIKTFENAIVTLSNSTILDNDFKNWTLNSPIARRDIKVGVAYGSEVQKVKKLLLEVANAHAHVLKKPTATVLFTDFGDSALQFVLRFWIDDVERNFITQSELREDIDKIFRENDVTIAFPQMDIRLNTVRNKS